MSSFNVGNIGSSNASGDFGNFATFFSGQVYEAWRNQPVLANVNSPVIHRRPMYRKGVTYVERQFADLPDAVKSYLGGLPLLGQAMSYDNVSFTRDPGLIVEHQVVAIQDEATADWDLFSRAARAQVRKVRMEFDRRCFVTACLAGRAAAKVSTLTGLNIHQGGNRVTRGGGATDATAVATAYPVSATGAANYRYDLQQLGYTMDTKAIPSEMRLLWHTPYMQQVLMQDRTANLFDKDFIEWGVTGGDVQRRQVTMVDGFKVIEPRVNTSTNQGSMPDQNFTDGPTAYQADFTPSTSTGSPVALVLSPGQDGDAAISIGSWLDLTPFFVWIPQNMCWLFGCYMLGSVGQFNPSCAGTIEVINS